MRDRPGSLSPLVLSLLALLLAACSGGAAAPAPAAKAVAAEQVDLVALIRSAAREKHPDFDKRRGEAVTAVDGYLAFLAGPTPLPPLASEPDPALRELYADAATLYELHDIVAAQALASRVTVPSPTGQKLQALIEMAYDPVGGEDMEGDSDGSTSRDLTRLATRSQAALQSLVHSGLPGSALALAKLDVRARVYDDGVAQAAAEAALAQADADGKIHAAVVKALGDAEN